MALPFNNPVSLTTGNFRKTFRLLSIGRLVCKMLTGFSHWSIKERKGDPFNWSLQVVNIYLLNFPFYSCVKIRHVKDTACVQKLKYLYIYKRRLLCHVICLYFMNRECKGIENAWKHGTALRRLHVLLAKNRLYDMTISREIDNLS